LDTNRRRSDTNHRSQMPPPLHHFKGCLPVEPGLIGSHLVSSPLVVEQNCWGHHSINSVKALRKTQSTVAGPHLFSICLGFPKKGTLLLYVSTRQMT